MILDQFKLDGKCAVVTGARTGLGFGIAKALAEAGADIVGVGDRAMPEIEAYVTSLGRRFYQIRADLRDTSAASGVLDEAVGAMGRIDILVNNAGIIRREDALDFTEENWDDVMNLNLKTMFFLSQAAAKQFIRQKSGGKIINIASMLSYQGGIRVVSYTSSKSGVMGMTRALANEWAKYGINVNAIAPGYMVTNNTEALRADEARSAAILDRIPAGRWGEPDDLGGAAVFLASAASDYVHGFTIAVDGAWLAR
ncbi:MAG: 2-dehydro-3-deoxy-D-gluconate 5-dehydrogenase KduD [Eubacteriales bacterium]